MLSSLDVWALLLCHLFSLECNILNFSSATQIASEEEQQKITCLVWQSKYHLQSTWTFWVRYHQVT